MDVANRSCFIALIVTLISASVVQAGVNVTFFGDGLPDAAQDVFIVGELNCSHEYGDDFDGWNKPLAGKNAMIRNKTFSLTLNLPPCSLHWKWSRDNHEGVSNRNLIINGSFEQILVFTNWSVEGEDNIYIQTWKDITFNVSFPNDNGNVYDGRNVTLCWKYGRVDNYLIKKLPVPLIWKCESNQAVVIKSMKASITLNLPIMGQASPRIMYWNWQLDGETFESSSSNRSTDVSAEFADCEKGFLFTIFNNETMYITKCEVSKSPPTTNTTSAATTTPLITTTTKSTTIMPSMRLTTATTFTATSIITNRATRSSFQTPTAEIIASSSTMSRILHRSLDPSTTESSLSKIFFSSSTDQLRDSFSTIKSGVSTNGITTLSFTTTEAAFTTGNSSGSDQDDGQKSPNHSLIKNAHIIAGSIGGVVILVVMIITALCIARIRQRRMPLGHNLADLDPMSAFTIEDSDSTPFQDIVNASNPLYEEQFEGSMENLPAAGNRAFDVHGPDYECTYMLAESLPLPEPDYIEPLSASKAPGPPQIRSVIMTDNPLYDSSNDQAYHVYDSSNDQAYDVYVEADDTQADQGHYDVPKSIKKMDHEEDRY